MKRPNNLPTLTLCVALSVAAAGAAAPASADEAAATSKINAVFGPAVDYAQKRCVKIFGAGIGRDPGYATGLIISNDGLILTAQGVYLSGERLRVALPDGSVHMAQLVRRSQKLQAAILKIETKTPDYFDLANEAKAKKGDWILAVSNAFKVADGPEPLSVNLGVYSLRTRMDAQNGVQDVPYDGELILIDAITSNPGAPGGAVVAVDGSLVGMVGRIMEGKSTSTRLNYAVPADQLQAFVLNKEPETPATMPPVAVTSANKGETGIRLVPLAEKRDPAYIDRVVPNSPAATAGLKSDDLIVSINGEVIHDVADYRRLIGTLAADVEAEFVVKRKNDVLTIKFKPAKAP